jgi:hypothetical protein
LNYAHNEQTQRKENTNNREHIRMMTTITNKHGKGKNTMDGKYTRKLKGNWKIKHDISE